MSVCVSFSACGGAEGSSRFAGMSLPYDPAGQIPYFFIDTALRHLSARTSGVRP